MAVFAILSLIVIKLGTHKMNLHLQVVLVMHMSGADACIKLITDHIKLWLDIWTNKNYHMKVVHMMQQKGHALFYMLGYCMKDQRQAHFHYVLPNLTRGMI